jgi:hypothetical protein
MDLHFSIKIAFNNSLAPMFAYAVAGAGLVKFGRSLADRTCTMLVVGL